MVTEKEANLAREQHAQRLRAMGAHAVMVDKVRRAGRSSFAVIAMFDEKPANAPRTLDVKVGKKVKSVPFIAKKAARFQAE